jgi:hypothetical protein
MNLNNLGMGKKLVDLVTKKNTSTLRTSNQTNKANKNERPVQQDQKK